jgi:hypothetical protein
MKILKEAYDAFGAEGDAEPIPAQNMCTDHASVVVFITSNYIGNSEIMQGCKEVGIPAFGTLWDFVSVIRPLCSFLPA